MDDLNEKLTGLLSSPEGMAKIQSLMAALGGGTAAPASSSPVSAETLPPKPENPVPPGNAGNPRKTETSVPPAASGLPELTALAKFLPLLSGAGKDNPDTRLLSALRPYLHGEREKRLEEAMGLMKLMRLLPLLQEQGILGGMKHDG